MNKVDGFWFKSDLFEIEEGEEEETNPHCYGMQLSGWLRKQFISLGYEVEEVIPEDWGWCVMCARKPYSLWVGCGSVLNESNAESKPDKNDIVWHCFVVAEVSFMKKVFGNLNTEEGVKRLSKELEAILIEDSRIELVSEP
ncbi:MAG: hypothetical protein KZQ82_13565 [Candidatus Thiodiazotropha sp. (ex Lucinoma annulata)]|nr:hypothetical protein [Candidatus Thiodiazotropha sp. (ex Lucinoma annulata)]